MMCNLSAASQCTEASRFLYCDAYTREAQEEHNVGPVPDK